MNLFLQDALILRLVQVPQSQTHFPVVPCCESSTYQLTQRGHVIYLWHAICYLYLLNIILDSGPRSNSVDPSDGDHCFLFDACHNFGPFTLTLFSHLQMSLMVSVTSNPNSCFLFLPKHKINSSTEPWFFLV